jgi:tetratricopeptide (TPR) repeat protein
MRFSALARILCLFALPHGAVAQERGVRALDWEIPLPGSARGTTFSVALAYPDTLAGSDTRAILDAMLAGKGVPALPRGRLDADEKAFLSGFQGLLTGNALLTVQNWSALRARALAPALAASLRVNTGVLSVLAGEPAAAESLWVREWRNDGPAADAAWRNLLSLQIAAGRPRRAEALADAMLAERPGHRAALVAKAALLRQYHGEDAWEEFVRARALAAPDMQLLYGEILVRRGKYAEAVRYLDQGLSELPNSGRGWRLLAEAQYHRGYYYFAERSLLNSARAGETPPEFYELYARLLRACCTGDSDDRAVSARAAAQELLEKGLPKNLHDRAMAQLLYHMYAQNLKPDAARALKEGLWFHFEGPGHEAPPLGAGRWDNAGLDARELRVKPGVYSLSWVLALRGTDVYRAEM